MVTLLIMTNGRKEYLTQTLSTLNNLHGKFSRRLIHDDSGDEEYGSHLALGIISGCSFQVFLSFFRV